MPPPWGKGHDGDRERRRGWEGENASHKQSGTDRRGASVAVSRVRIGIFVNSVPQEFTERRLSGSCRCSAALVEELREGSTRRRTLPM